MRILLDRIFLALTRFEITPKAFANSSPGFERSENPGLDHTNIRLNPEKVRHVRR